MEKDVTQLQIGVKVRLILGYGASHDIRVVSEHFFFPFFRHSSSRQTVPGNRTTRTKLRFITR